MRNKESLAMIHENTEKAAKSVSHTTKSVRQGEAKTTPEDVTMRDRAAARCTRLRARCSRQARKVRAEHDVKCSLMPGKRIPKRKPAASQKTGAPEELERRFMWMPRRPSKNKKRGL